MYVRKSLSHGKIYLSYVKGYTDENGKTKQKTVKKIGYLEDLKKEYNDPITYFKNKIKEFTNDELTTLTINNINTKKIDSQDCIKNLGYSILKNVYQELGIKELLNEIQKESKIEYGLNEILSFLVFMRVIQPSSKKEAYENRNMLFEKCNFELNDIYRSLTKLNPLQGSIQKTIWENTKEAYKRDTSKSYYDCTNYYFEIEYNDEDEYEIDENGEKKFDENGNPILKKKGLRKRGPEKNHRPDPIVEMGLLMDSSGIPLSYDIFPGNESEKLSLLPILKRTKSDFDLGRTIIVADRGLNTSDNIIKISGISIEQAKKMNGYLYGQSVRGADEEFKSWVLSDGYTVEKILDDNGKEITFKHKSRIAKKKVRVIREDKGKTKSGNDKVQTILIDQKQMVYFSQKYADKQKRDRDMIIAKAKDLMSHPDRYTKATSYGVAGYVKNLKFVKDTGEVANASELSLNEERIHEEEKYDGYYSIVTSEENLTDLEMRKIYRGLSKIEETFKVTKSGLESRPVWLSRQDRIESHFLTCFIALVLIRLIEKKLNMKYSFEQIINSIRKYNSLHIEHDVYIQNFSSEIIDDFEQIFNIPFSKKYMTLSEIRKILK